MKCFTKGKGNLGKKKKKGTFTVICFLKTPFCQCFATWNKNASEKQKTQIKMVKACYAFKINKPRCYQK